MSAAISRRQHLLALVLSAAVLAALLIATPGKPALATPVASDPVSYNGCDRIFPDPQAFWAGPTGTPAPDQSPFAKGQAACQANDFIGYQEMIDGNSFMEELFPQFVEFYALEEDFGDGTDCSSPSANNNDYCSAGLASHGGPDEFEERRKHDLYLLRITDERVPDTNKKFFAYPLSIHGIERAGVEGGTRAAEDLATWAWCQAQLGGESPQGPIGSAAGASVDCAREGEIPHPVLETQPQNSLSAGEVLKQSVQYFIYANADGWRRGDPDNVPRGYTRYNGNSVDLNRDWPTMGYTFRPYTPWSEPESKGFGEVLEGIRDEWTGGIDLHGQLIDRAFSFTLLGAGQHDYAKNQRILQTVKGAWEDAENRLEWHPLVIRNDEPQTCVVDATVVEVCDGIYGVQWGTVWDTIDYTITGGFGDWINSPLGLNGDGIDNEMSMSHIANCGTGTCFLKDFEQLHVDGNKSLIFAMANYHLLPEDTDFRAPGKVGYVFDPRRIQHDGAPTAPNPYAGLPPQPSEDGQLNVTNQWKFEFDVRGPSEGFYNGGLEALATPNNLGGFDFSTTPATTALVLEQYLPREEDELGTDPGADAGCGVEDNTNDDTNDDPWVERNRYYNAGQLYFSSGQAVHTNFPTPGLWRVCMTGGIPQQFATTGGNVNIDVNFLGEQGWPDPGQLPYDVSNMDFFSELKPYMRKNQLQKVKVQDVLRENKGRKGKGGKGRAPTSKPRRNKKGKSVNLNQFTSLVIADQAFPGHYEQPKHQTTGPAQEGETHDNPGLATAPCAGDDTSEFPCSEDIPFEVQPGYNNLKMIVSLVPSEGSVDWDLYVQRHDPGSDTWVTVSQSATGSSAEKAEMETPPPGQYRARVVNWAGGTPPSQLVIEFSNDAGDPVPPDTRPQKEINRWGKILERYVRRGGNLVLTDGAIKNLAYMGILPRDQIETFDVYAGYVGFTRDEGDTDTYSDPLAKDINQPGAAEGSGHRHQTYEPVPIGFEIQNESGGNNNDAPVWTVNQPTWESLGGRTAGTTTPEKVSLGELSLGKGQIRIIGALLPMPSDQAYHPYGLASYAVTYSGYQLFNNALQAGGARGCQRVLRLPDTFNKILGTEEKDVLTGTPGPDAICGGGDKDRIKGLDGDDVIVGGKGRDRLVGGTGNDGIFAGADNDRVLGGKGNDRLIGFRGDDRLAGGGGRDRMNGMAGQDACTGGTGPDKARRCERGKR